jgi:NAD(P)-dependent dehydrogenase (short-subunit alcohol dehydrogenase family)
MTPATDSAAALVAAPDPAPAATSLRGRAALVTGAGSGLGAALAQMLSAAGARVALADLAHESAQQVARQLGRPDDTLALRCDVGDADAVQSAVRTTAARFGAIDILINNAGTDVTVDLEGLSVRDWDRVLATNLRGPFLLSKAALPWLQQSSGGRGGHIINITSTAARRAWANASAYHASKWGLLGLSQALHAELRPQGIRVTGVIVGGMRTPFLLQRFKDLDPARLQDPANVALAVRGVLEMPRESVVAEITVLPMQETSWP